MGQKVNPHGFRVGVIKDWDSRWYARNEKVGDLIVEDQKIRKFLKKTLYATGVPRIEIERDNSVVRIYLHCARPGMILGKDATEVERLRQQVEKMIGKPTQLNIVEVKRNEVDTTAQLVAENIAQQLEKRTSFRRAMKNAIGRSMRSGAKGIKVMLAGRLNGAEIARSETYHEGTIPCRPCVRASTMALQKLPPPMVASASRCGSTRAKCSARPCAPPPVPSTCPSPTGNAATVVVVTAAAAAATTATATTTVPVVTIAAMTALPNPRKEETANAAA